MKHLAILCMIALLTIAGCSSEDIVDPNKLCPQGAAIGARISGGPQAVDMCVSQEDTDALYDTVPNEHYDVVSATTSAGVQVTIEVYFAVYPSSSWPVALIPTGDRGLAETNPQYVFFGYREVTSGQTLVSTTVTGNFTLSFSDASIAVASFSELTIALEDEASPGTEIGTRSIGQGFVSVSAD